MNNELAEKRIKNIISNTFKEIKLFSNGMLASPENVVKFVYTVCLNLNIELLKCLSNLTTITIEQGAHEIHNDILKIVDKIDKDSKKLIV